MEETIRKLLTKNQSCRVVIFRLPKESTLFDQNLKKKTTLSNSVESESWQQKDVEKNNKSEWLQ